VKYQLVILTQGQWVVAVREVECESDTRAIIKAKDFLESEAGGFAVRVASERKFVAEFSL
jgi:hypothetical protein